MIPVPSSSPETGAAAESGGGAPRVGASHRVAHIPSVVLPLSVSGTRLKLDATRDLRNLRESGRLLALVAIVSVAMGAAGWAFLTGLKTVTALREAEPLLFLLLIPVGAGTAWLYQNHGLAASRGNNLVIESALTGRLIHARMAFLTFCCSIATHLAGGSAGREGTAVQIGGTIASNVSGLFHLDAYDHHDLMLAGISAAFGAVFGTPLAGAFFGMEMCFVGKLEYRAALYCLAGSFMGNAVARLLGVTHAAHAIGSVPLLDARTIALTVGAGIVFGVVARLFSGAIRLVKRVYARIPVAAPVRALVGAGVLLAVFLLTGSQRLGGLSEWMVDAGFSGASSPLDALGKLVLTALTLGAGFQGGEVTPLFDIGASLGGWMGVTAGFAPALPAALGMLGVFGAALNVPITTIMLGIDMFGGAAAPYFVIVSFVSYLVAGHRGVYPAQRIVTPKRRSLAPDVEHTVEEAIAARAEMGEVRGPVSGASGADAPDAVADAEGPAA